MNFLPLRVLRWHHRGWRAYWRRRSRWGGKAGRRPIAPELRDLIRRMAAENRPWGQRRIQAELPRLGFRVSARTIGKYMRRPRDGEPSPRWRTFLKQHASAIWACDFLCMRTVFFQTLYVFFVVDHANREVLHVQTTRHPTAEWASRQIIECCGWDREPPRFLIHDRDGCYGAVFDRRVRALGITQIRTPFRSPQANSVAERWVGSLRRECLDYVIFNEHHLRAVLAEYAHAPVLEQGRTVTACRPADRPHYQPSDLGRAPSPILPDLICGRDNYYNAYRVHRSLGGTTPAQCAGASSAAAASLDRHAWRQHCRGLFQTPIAA